MGSKHTGTALASPPASEKLSRMAASGQMLIRVRGKDGMWRVGGLDDSARISDVKARVEALKGVEAATQTLSLEPKGDALSDEATLRALGIAKGDILFIRYEGTAAPAASAASTGLKIEGGKVVTVAAKEEGTAGFRPGMQAMRDIKKQWNWMDFMDLSRALEFTLKQQTEAHCSKVTLDTGMVLNFVRHVQGLAFQTTRVTWLYGFFTEKREVVAVCAYEPPQLASPDDCKLLDDPHAETVETVAEMLGLERVGIMYSHPPRNDPDRAFSVIATEVIMAARAQADAGPSSPFVTVKVTSTEAGEVSTEAYQVSDQGCEMVVREAVTAGEATKEQLEAAAKAGPGEGKAAASSAGSPAPADAAAAAISGVGRSLAGRTKATADAGKPAAEAPSAASVARMTDRHELVVDPRFHCIVEAKPAPTVDVAFVLVHVPIGQATYFMHSDFPKAARRLEQTGLPLRPADLKAQLESKSKAFGIEDALRDFELLVYLAEQPFLASIMQDVCDAVLDAKAVLEEGHKDMLNAFAASD